MSGSIYRAMYGISPVAPNVETKSEREKRAVKVLGGMKIHNSHMKQIQVGEELINVPKIEFVSLLEGQIKELRAKLRASEEKVNRLENNCTRISTDLVALRRELAGKVILK